MRDPGFFARSVLVAVVSTATLHAQATMGPAADCANAQLDPSKRIQACNDYLNLPDADDEQLAVAYVDRGDAYDQQGNYDNAIKDYDEALQYQPDDAAAFNNRGSAHLSKREYDRAIRDMSEAIRLDPNSAAFVRNRGAAWLDDAEFSKAADDFDRAIHLEPTNATAWGDRCLVHAILGDLKDAQTDCDHARKIETANLSALFGLGLLDLKSGNAPVAQAAYSYVIENARAGGNLLPGHTLERSFAASAQYGRGIAEEMQGNRRAADLDIGYARRLDSGVAERFARWGVTEVGGAAANQRAAGNP